MKLASYVYRGEESYGVVVGDGIIDLGKRLGTDFPDLRSLIEGAGVDEAREMVGGAPADFSASLVDWLPVVPNADKYICVGLNYKAHINELGRKMEDHPTLFLRMPSSHVGHLQPIIRPKVSEKFDYEGELALVIGKGGRHIPEDKAMDCIAGYTIYNDGSIRDYQRHTQQYTPGKNFWRSGSFGPWMVTADEIPDPRKLRLQTRLNGTVLQDTLIDDLMFNIPQIIAYASIFTPLMPGDVIITGTPGGVGGARNPPIWMKPGDTVEVEIDKIGILRNPVAQEI
jgi:2-keto-4-pentenoate hydratase/2-oxohepta-3-ene-1,7-dioic acid hydratase in catechol pathway